MIFWCDCTDSIYTVNALHLKCTLLSLSLYNCEFSKLQLHFTRVIIQQPEETNMLVMMLHSYEMVFTMHAISKISYKCSYSSIWIHCCYLMLLFYCFYPNSSFTFTISLSFPKVLICKQNGHLPPKQRGTSEPFGYPRGRKLLILPSRVNFHA